MEKVFANFDIYPMIKRFGDKDTKYKFLHWLYVLIKPVDLENKPFVFMRNTKGFELYFLHSGEVEYVMTYLNKKTNYHSLQTGDIFGMEDFIFNLPKNDRNNLFDGNLKFSQY